MGECMIYAHEQDYRMHEYMLRAFGIHELCILEQISSALFSPHS